MKDPYYGGVTYWVGHFNQSMDHKYAFAQYVADKLKEVGIKATARLKLD